MSQRFIFDLPNGVSTIRNEDGVEAADLDEAIKEAWAVLEEMRIGDELSDEVEGWSLVVQDAAGANLMTPRVVPSASSASTAS